MKKTNDLQQHSARKSILVIFVLFLISAALSILTGMIYTSSVMIVINNYISLIINTFIIFMVLVAMYGYFYYQVDGANKSFRNLVIIVSMIFFTVCVTAICIHYLNLFVAPIAMSAVIVGLVVGRSLGYVANITTSGIMLAVNAVLICMLGGSMEVLYASSMSIAVATLMSFFMMYLISRNYTRFKLVFGALGIGVLGSFMACVFVLPLTMDWRSILLSYGYTFAGCAIGVAGFSIMIPLYEEVFDVWTNFKLAEVCSLNRSLLRRLASEAPGTFNHSIVVADLAESCAIAIGENPYLAKACGLYHDVGKLTNPEYFVENQDGGYNPHDDLVPESSARMIISHCMAGYEILRSHRLPEEIASVSREHHGTTVTRYFYEKARSVLGGEVDSSHFCYEGPKPTSKIAAIIMIVDSVEAATRAKSPDNPQELRKIVDNIVAGKIEQDQFSDCEITFADLDAIKDTIVKFIPAVYHKRIDY